MQKIIENYVLYEVVGSGQYGKVHRAINKKTNETVAIKVVPLTKFSDVPKLEEFTTNEIKILGKINNPNVIRFIEMLKTANNMYLVYEFCEGGTLESILSVREHLPEQEALKIFQHLLNACRELYKENILHRDIKPSNILIHKGVIKLADFGFCKRLHSPSELTFSMVGSPIYMAPEILRGFPYTIKADIWSLGVLLFELLFGTCPYEDKTLAGLISQFSCKQVSFPRDINNISLNTETLLKKMLTIDPKQRIDWDDLMKYPLFPTEDPNAARMSSKIQPKIQMEGQMPNGVQKPASGDAFYAILHTLVTERNKVMYLTAAFHTILQENLTLKAPIVAFLLVKRAKVILDELKRELSVDANLSKYKVLPHWELFRKSEEHKVFSRYIDEEYEEFEQLNSLYKEEVNKILSSKSSLDDANDQSLKQEASNSVIDAKFYCNTLIGYAEEIKTQVFARLVNKQDDTAAISVLSHANEVLDCADIDDFSEKNMKANMRWEENEYFENLKKFDKDRISDIITKKINFLKLKAY